MLCSRFRETLTRVDKMMIYPIYYKYHTVPAATAHSTSTRVRTWCRLLLLLGGLLDGEYPEVDYVKNV